MRSGSRTAACMAMGAAVAISTGCELEIPGTKHYDQWRLPASTEVAASFGAHGFETLLELHVAAPPGGDKPSRFLSIDWVLSVDPAPNDAGVVSDAKARSFGLRVEVMGVSASELASEGQYSVPNPELCAFPITQDIAFPEIRQTIVLRCGDGSVCTRDLKVKVTAVPVSSMPIAGEYRLIFNAALNGLGAGIPETAKLEWSDAKVTQLRDHPQTAGDFCP